MLASTELSFVFVFQAFDYGYIILQQAVGVGVGVGGSALVARHSALGRVLRVTDHVLQYRRWVRDTFQPYFFPRAHHQLLAHAHALPQELEREPDREPERELDLEPEPELDHDPSDSDPVSHRCCSSMTLQTPSLIDNSNPSYDTLDRSLLLNSVLSICYKHIILCTNVLTVWRIGVMI